MTMTKLAKHLFWRHYSICASTYEAIDMIQRAKHSPLAVAHIRSPSLRSAGGGRKQPSRLVTFCCLAVVKALLTLVFYSNYAYISSRIKESSLSVVGVPIYEGVSFGKPVTLRKAAAISPAGDEHVTPLLPVSKGGSIARNEVTERRPIESSSATKKVVDPRQSSATADIHDFRFKPAHHRYNITDDIEDKASVDYLACCGLGHRLSKMTDAHYLAHQLGYGLRGFWGYCDDVEVFSYLFGPQPPSELGRVTIYNMSARIGNVVPGVQRLVRNGHGECACHFGKMQQDVEFYAGLRERFRFRDAVTDFRTKHFADRTVFAMHLRAGNGETGDYVWKKRGIQNETEWMANFARQLQKLVVDASNPVLFLATDTPSFIGKLREVLKDIMPVMHYEQERLGEGEGVLFGERGANISIGSREDCLRGWENSLMDMMLLSYADVVIAGRPSSFVESLPMSLVLDTNSISSLHMYCEVNQAATKFQCFHDIQDWCCNGTTSFAGHFRHEFAHNPPENITEDLLARWNVGPRTRGQAVPTQKLKYIPSYLPYDATEYDVKALA